MTVKELIKQLLEYNMEAEVQIVVSGLFIRTLERIVHNTCANGDNDPKHATYIGLESE